MKTLEYPESIKILKEQYKEGIHPKRELDETYATSEVEMKGFANGILYAMSIIYKKPIGDVHRDLQNT